MYCGEDYITNVDPSEIFVFEYPPYGEFRGIKCRYCGKNAKIYGRQTVSIIVKDGNTIERDLKRFVDDPEKSSKIQEQIISERQKEIKTSSVARRKYKEQHERAMKNKAEWVRRGRRPEERMEAIKG